MSPFPMSSPLAPGVLLDRYELLFPIATGGMASVWVARLRGKRGFEKLVAVKTVRADHAGDSRVQKMFLDEANLAAAVRHPNVVEILDLGEQHGTLYLAMEWIEGDSLSTLRKAMAARGALLPPRVSMRVVADACAGLHAAHELRGPDGRVLGLVHRDVSPQNILVSTTGGTKVIDFGIAKALGRLSDETAAGVIKGKIHYMAPEQACGAAVDRRSDIWSLGVVLYQLLSGRYPYEGDSHVATLYLITSGQPPPPIGGIPPQLGAVLDAAIAPDPARRFPTAAEMQRAIEWTLSALYGPTTSDDVAAFVREHLGDHVAARRATIDQAIATANARGFVEAQPPPVADVWSERPAHATPASRPGRSIDPVATRAEPVSSRRQVLPASPLAEPTSAADSPASALRATSSEFPPADRARRRRLRGVAVGVVGGAVVLIAAALVAREAKRLSGPTMDPAASRAAPTASRAGEPVPQPAPTASGAEPGPAVAIVPFEDRADAGTASAPLPGAAPRGGARGASAAPGDPSKRTKDSTRGFGYRQ